MSESDSTGQEAGPPLTLHLQEDGLRAVISTIHIRTTVAQIRLLLEKNGVCEGISERRMRQAVRTAHRTSRPVHDVVVAQGRPPRAASPPKLIIHTPEELDAPPPLAPVRDLLSEEPDGVARRAPPLTAWVVRSGDRLATIEQTRGERGIDVMGRPIPVPAPDPSLPSDPLLTPGSGVEPVEGGTAWIASCFGYAGLLDGRFTVLEPLWISADMMQACFLMVPDPSGPQLPTRKDLEDLLASSGITDGIDERAIDRLSAGSCTGPLTAIARGNEPVPACDRTPDFPRDWSFRIGSVREDGSIDFHERNLYPAVQTGDLLATCPADVEGLPGQTVFGIPIDPPPDPPFGLQLIAGENVQRSVQGDMQRLVADHDGGMILSVEDVTDTDGAVRGRRYRLDVQPVVHIASDVGLETGNIDVKGHILIDGSITSGFEVRATGGIAVGGSVETGTRVEAGGDIAIRQGIVGRGTKITAGGSINARFVQEARLRAGGDITIGSYIHSAHVESAGHVRVEGLGGSGNSGGIVGGQTWALDGITTQNAGSSRGSSTLLCAGITAEQAARLEEIRAQMEGSDRSMSRLLAAMGIVELTAPAVKARVDEEPDRRAQILDLVRQAKELEGEQQAMTAEFERRLHQIAASSAGVVIRVVGQAFADVCFRIGKGEQVLKDALQGQIFSLSADASEVISEPLPQPK